MSCFSSPGAHVLATAYLMICLTGCDAQKVYFDCGAKVDMVDAQGLILSPGFPYNYSSGTHCVWQFFVPVNYQLILEIFDFDVFERHNPAAPYSAATSNFDEVETTEAATAAPRSLPADKGSAASDPAFVGDDPRTRQPSQNAEVKQVVVQEVSTKMEIAKVSNSAKRSADVSSDLSPPPPPPPPPSSRLLRPENSASSSHLRGELQPSSNPVAPVEETTPPSGHYTTPAPESSGTQHSVVDACPHDVLYISDLITFSSRFCGSNRPPSSQLVFGSSQEMVEVIMELITTTHWGRGFALLFQYHNLTEAGGQLHTAVAAAAATPSATKVASLLAAVSGVAFFALVLATALCVIFRPKLCPKRAGSCASSNSEAPQEAQSGRAEVSELQLMADNQSSLEVTAEREHDAQLPHAAGAGSDASQDAEVDLSSSGLTELDLGADEVFLVSSPSSPSRLPFCPHTQRERFLRHSDTGPGPAADWPSSPDSASPSSARSAAEGGASARPRAWSVRTFQDFLPPLPQLHRKWCSWNSTSPFTKLVDSAPPSLAADCRAGDGGGAKVFSDVHLQAKSDRGAASESAGSSASYPLTQPAQRQRRLNSVSNLRRSRFTPPCFGLLADPPQGCGPEPGPCSPSSSSSTSSSAGAGAAGQCVMDGEHVSVPVFAISEEEDRQPLVASEHLDQPNGHAARAPPHRPEAKRPSADCGPARWRPWGSQASGGVLPSGTLYPPEVAVSAGEPPFIRSAPLCSVTNRV